MHTTTEPLQAPESQPPRDLLDRASLFLDFDGTLVELADRPDGVTVTVRLSTLLKELAERLNGRMAIVSGRPAMQVLELLPGGDTIVVGSHGLQFHYPGGHVSIAERPVTLEEVLGSLEELSRIRPGVIVEDKPLGAAIHYRLCPSAESECLALADALARKHGLYLQTGKMMVEVRAPGGDKGSAIRQLMSEPGMAGTRPLFLGDDDTDEPGFVAAAELGGAGILVGAARPSAAKYRLEGVSDVIEWLERASAA